MTNPKLFISYSWSSPSHEEWVLMLATELRQAGVDVILDKWDLKKGHDAIAFMERMVADAEIKKVAMIVDKTYTEKADGRSGGVGTETQIISREVYEKQEQDKFVALPVEKDEHGKSYLPIYYKSRIHIDFTDSEKYAEKFEELLRWIFDKPLHIKPALGNIPGFINADNPIQIPTSASFKRALDALRHNKASALVNLNEYLETLAEGFESFRIGAYTGEFDDAVVNSIEEFIPFRREFIEIINAVGKYTAQEEFAFAVHKFFEQILPYTQRPKEIMTYRSTDFDNFKFIVTELFLCTISIFIKFEKFAYANYLMEQQYYIGRNPEFGLKDMVSYAAFKNDMGSLRGRNQRLKLNRLSLFADLIKQRAESTGIQFNYLMQAEFVLFMRGEIEGERWWPETLVFAERMYGAFEIFARSVSKRYFDKIKILLNIETPKDLDKLFAAYKDGSRRLPTWDYAFATVNPSVLMGYEQLATKP